MGGGGGGGRGRVLDIRQKEKRTRRKIEKTFLVLNKPFVSKER